jgi:DNA-binding MurR/RpiR family transcriptional regulator
VTTKLGNDDVLSRIAAAHPKLTTAMARLAHYISQNYLRAGFMSTRELGAASGVSMATVVRFMPLIGYADFDAFRDAIRARVDFELTGVDRLEAMSDEGSPSALLARVVEADIDALRAMLRSLNQKSFTNFANSLSSAERVTIVGLRYVAPLAHYFAYSLLRIRDGIEAVTTADSTTYDRIRLLGKRDVLVLLAFARYPKELSRLAHYAHERGVKILALTDGPASPITPMASAILTAKACMLDFIGSLSAPAAMISAVVSYLGTVQRKSTRDRLRALEESAIAGDTYIRGA